MFEDIKKQRPDQNVQKTLDVWGPTPYGNYPKISFRPSDKTAAYMTLHDVGVEPDQSSQKMHLWVYDITFAWTMNYAQSQTVFGKSFYPRHMQVGNVIVKCQTASQAHYDEIVNMVVDYQQNAILATTEAENKNAYKIVRFEIPEAKYKINRGRGEIYPREDGPLDDADAIYKYERLWFEGYPIAVAAGHRKAVYQPELELTFAVLSYKDDLDILARVQSQYNPEQDPFGNDEIQEIFKANLATNTVTSPFSATSAAFNSGYTQLLPNGNPRPPQ
jgi:hypothetical protein